MSAAGDQVGRSRTKALTPAQERVMRMVCAGMSTAQMCAKLRRSHWTIRNHLKAVFKTYHVHSRVQLMARALHHNAP